MTTANVSGATSPVSSRRAVDRGCAGARTARRTRGRSPRRGRPRRRAPSTARPASGAPSGRGRGPTATRPADPTPRARPAASATPMSRAAIWSRPARRRRTDRTTPRESRPHGDDEHDEAGRDVEVGLAVDAAQEGHREGGRRGQRRGIPAVGHPSRKSSPLAMASTNARIVARCTRSSSGRLRPPASSPEGQDEEAEARRTDRERSRSVPAATPLTPTPPRRAGTPRARGRRGRHRARPASSGAGPAPPPRRGPPRPGSPPR